MILLAVPSSLLFFIFFSGLSKNQGECKKHSLSDGDDTLADSSELFASGYLQSDEAAATVYGTSNGAGGATGSVLPGNHPSQQKCLDIPQNMSLCHGIGYTQMLIPNLMEHETVREANEQSQTWMPLANIKCHQHTRLFLCSLFAPICPMQAQPADPLMPINSDQTLISAGPVIFPCRSLCESVKLGCQGVMSKHGFPWPEMLSCSRFPLDNDMCISPNPVGQGPESRSGADIRTTLPTTTTARTLRTRRPSVGHRSTSLPKTTSSTIPFYEMTTPAFTNLATEDETCAACTFVSPPNQLDDAYCQAEFVAKVRFRRFTRRGVFLVKKPKILKLAGKLSASNHSLLEEEMKKAKSVEFLFEPEKMTNRCRHLCAEKVELRTQLYLVIGTFLTNSKSPVIHPASSRSLLPQIGMQLILPWFSGQNSRDFRQAEKRLQNLKCTSRPDGSHFRAGWQKKAQRGKKSRPF